MSDRDLRAPGVTRGLVWTAAACITVSLLVMIGIAVAGPSISVPEMAHTPSGPPWWVSLGLPDDFVLFTLWAAAILAAVGVGAGLLAVARGARPPVKPLLAASFIAIAVFTVLAPAGTTDTQSYAIDGNTVVLGHSPYVDTPLQMVALGDKLAINSPGTWAPSLSDYGPVATAEEWVSAERGGASMAAITFWLKLWVAISFGAVVLMLDRLCRGDPAMRLRAHLLWSVNPLLLWEIVASGHIDGLAALFGLLGVAALRARGGKILLRDAALAGLLIGVATGIKVEYALFGLAVAWACRRSVKPLAAAAAGFAVAVVPAYLAAGTPAIKILVTRSPGITWDTMYQLFWRPVLGYTQFSVTSVPPHLELVAYLLFAAVAVLAVARFPDRVPDLPAVTPALALSVAWLFVTAFQRPWYDVMAISLLALYSASRLDWVVLIRLLAGATVYVQAVQSPFEPHWLADITQFDGAWLTPGVRLLTTVALAWLCLSGRWGWRSAVAASSGRLPELLPTA